MSKETGGPAFPFEYHNRTTKAQKSFFSDSLVCPDGAEQYAGITARDYFAAKAINGILSDPSVSLGDDNLAQYAAIAYKAADAMLAARDK